MACFRNPAFGNDHNRVAPIDDRAACWNAVVTINSLFAATKIGPRLICTAKHIGLMPIGVPIDLSGVTRTAVSVTESLIADAQYIKLDADLPGAWATLWNGEAYTSETTNLLAIHGYGLGRGAEIYDGPTLIGWSPGDPTTRARRWSQGKLFAIDIAPPVGLLTSFSSKFEGPGSECGFVFNGDSGSGGFIDAGTGSGLSKWLYLGPVVSASTSEARFDYTTYGVIGTTIKGDKAIIDALNGPLVTPQTITITDPGDGFDMAGSVLPIVGVVTGGITQVTVRVNGALRRVTVTGSSFSTFIDIPVFGEPSVLTIDAFDGTTFANSTVFSNTIHGEAINLPPDPGPCPEPGHWIEEGYETLLQSEYSLMDSDEEKTVRDIGLDFTHADEAGPLFCHSQIGVGGLANCIDWWTAEPWPLDCNLFGNIDPTKRNTGPMTWPFYATGRYVGWRIYVSDQSDPYDYSPKGGAIDFNRISMTISVRSSCR